MNPIHILLAGTDSEFTGYVNDFLSGEGHLEIAGWAITGQETLDYIQLLHPDLVLVDFSAPTLEMVSAVRQAKAANNSPCVILLTPHAGQEYQALAYVLNADAVLARSNISAELIPLINRLFAIGLL